jgi:hypothetical protein
VVPGPIPRLVAQFPFPLKLCEDDAVSPLKVRLVLPLPLGPEAALAPNPGHQLEMTKMC